MVCLSSTKSHRTRMINNPLSVPYARRLQLLLSRLFMLPQIIRRVISQTPHQPKKHSIQLYQSPYDAPMSSVRNIKSDHMLGYIDFTSKLG